LLATATARRVSLTTKLAVGLVVITGASYAWSITQTMSNGSAAYFSPFTRAWELALGALVAVAAPQSHRLSPRIAASLTWVGVAAVVIAAMTFDKSTPFPGSLAMLPVAGTALVIFGGTQAPRMGAEAGLRLAPLQWLGAISYALYLFHWPIMTIYAEQGTKTPSVGVNLVLVGIAVALATLSYRLIENPIRRSRTLNARRVLSLAIIPTCIAASLLCIFALRKANHLSLGRTGQEVHVLQTRTPIPARRAYEPA
jgi:peptidoglycan/LPS O-acetylase OafA/YrhL